MEKNIQIKIRSFSETDSKIRDLLLQSGGEGVISEGYQYFQLGDTVFSCMDSTESRMFIGNIPFRNKEGETIISEETVWKDILRGSVKVETLSCFGIADYVPRCVVLFRPLLHIESHGLQEIIPLEPMDYAVSLDNGDTAIILSMKNRMAEEVEEFVRAAAETMESEAGISCMAGIGNPAKSVRSVSVSYEEAVKAVETGIRHHIPGSVYVYKSLALERVSDLIPVQESKRFRDEIIPPETRKTLTDELIETIRIYFRNDLNLSITARELFLHRNTLLYRLEKIRKATGLDLRRFEDAAVFRLLMCLSEKQD